MKVLAINGSRSDWGYFKPILEHAKESNLAEIDLMHCNMAPLNSHGNLSAISKNEGFAPKYRIYNAFAGDDYYASSKSVASLSSSISDILYNSKYDWVLLAGDRPEQLSAAVAAMFMHVPSAHIQAGERSGNIDGITRHVLGKMVSLHFPANQDAYERLIELGEEKERVVLTGAPQLDHLFTHTASNDIISRINKKPNGYYVCIFHPDTENLNDTRKALKNTLFLLGQQELPIVYILPNNDTGSSYIRELIINSLRAKDNVFENLPRSEFISLLKLSAGLIGNSSAGILEAPLLRIGAVNIGERQRGRFRGPNVIDATTDVESINKAIVKLQSSYFLDQLKTCESIYGKKPAAPIILKALFDRWKAQSRHELCARGITV